jgi:hypothetical protein
LHNSQLAQRFLDTSNYWQQVSGRQNKGYLQHEVWQLGWQTNCFINKHFSAYVPAGRYKFSYITIIQLKNNIRQQFQADRTLIPAHRQALNVVGNP